MSLEEATHELTEKRELEGRSKEKMTRQRSGEMDWCGGCIYGPR